MWCTLLFALTAGVTLAVAAGDPFIGTWKLNAAKSKMAPDAPALRTALVRIEAAGQSLRFTTEGNGADGKPLNFAYEAPLDGKTAGAVTGAPFMDSTVMKRADRRTVIAIARKDGKEVFRDRRVVSKGGRTLTISRSGTTGAGTLYHSTFILERQ